MLNSFNPKPKTLKKLTGKRSKNNPNNHLKMQLAISLLRSDKLWIQSLIKNPNLKKLKKTNTKK
jgi:hypothetical protein